MSKTETKENNEAKKEESPKKHLLMQILKFAVVGGLSCVIDFAIYSAMYYGFLVNIMDEIQAAGVASVFGFLISLIFNYFASMAFVFERKEDANKVQEFIIFAVLSLIGLGLNTAIIMGVMWMDRALVQGQSTFFAAAVTGTNNVVNSMYIWSMGVIGKTAEAVDWIPVEAKIIATAIVMVYNFVTRKMFIEKK